MISMTDEATLVGIYIDSKVDSARNKAKSEPMERDFYNHLAIALDAIADEIRIGLHRMGVDKAA